MTSAASSTPEIDWQQRASQHLVRGHYNQAKALYEQAIEAEPDIKSHYWHLGLMQLLQQQEEEAQATWWLAMAEGEATQIEHWTAELLQVLQAEAERQAALENPSMAWAIRRHMLEIDPQDINNLLHIIPLSIESQTFDSTELAEFGIIELLQSVSPTFNADLLFQALKYLIEDSLLDEETLAFIEACLPYIQPPLALVDVLLSTSITLAHSALNPRLASRLLELGLQLTPDNINILGHLSHFYQDSKQYLKAIEIAKRRCSLAANLSEQVFSSHVLLRALLAATGCWEESFSAFQQHISLLSSLIEVWPTGLDQISILRTYTSTFFLPYFQDTPRENRQLHNQIGRLCQENLLEAVKEQIGQYRRSGAIANINRKANKVLKVGYISHCLKQHSVGWISRWLFQHHDRANVQIYAYLVNQAPISDFSQRWFVDQADRAYGFKIQVRGVLDRIYQDELDILVDLDSITLDGLAPLLTIKPAPIQVTWLGWDASGLPAIDYFIADPYVLPESAQDYYSETIYRLPQTYVAVDGFEVGIPSLRREQLDIPDDAVVYLLSQTGCKHNLNNIRQQIRIIKAVPGSYLLIKGLADEKSRGAFFEQIAEEEGVACDRLRFLPFVSREVTHRANLGIADVVLDTYPYNGATTTLETLWMGIPLVTQVGQQFSSRNSYTMMMNAGITEGIAWNEDEYLEWGVRLGTDETLRQQVRWKLLQSRRSAPLWNAQKFTREMENAYRQMWLRYLESTSS